MDYVFPKCGDRELGLNAPVGKIAGDQLHHHHFPCTRLLAHSRKNFPLTAWSYFGGAILRGGVSLSWPCRRNGSELLANGAFGDWLGHGYLGDDTAPSIRITSWLHCILTVFSVGEAFYSPRVYEYAAAIAPPGQEASYGSLAYLPFLVGKVLVGTSGWLLAMFCPATGPRRSDLMWLIFACAASVAPIGLVALPFLHSRARSRT